MRTFILSVFMVTFLWLGARSATAQVTEVPPSLGAPSAAPSSMTGRGLGVGWGSMMFGGPAGVSVAYDAGQFHIDSMLFARDLGPTPASYGLGLRFWWHLFSASAADLSVGGGIGFMHITKNTDIVNIDAGAQIRAFIVSNVALSAASGLSIVTGDADAWQLGGQSPTGTAGIFGTIGIHYYFQ